MATGRVFRVGLTGGIASGKSIVADMFAARGVPVIDTDVIAREVVEPGCPALDDIRRRFGDDVFSPGGRLDRRRLRDIVFDDPAAREDLEALLHPRIRDAALRRSAGAGGPYQVIVVPLMVGSSLQAEMDRILVVDCSEALQLERLAARDGETPEQARRMLDAQASRAERLAIADDILDNEGSLEHAESQVQNLHMKYLQLAKQAPLAG